MAEWKSVCLLAGPLCLLSVPHTSQAEIQASSVRARPRPTGGGQLAEGPCWWQTGCLPGCCLHLTAGLEREVLSSCDIASAPLLTKLNRGRWRGEPFSRPSSLITDWAAESVFEAERPQVRTCQRPLPSTPPAQPPSIQPVSTTSPSACLAAARQPGLLRCQPVLSLEQ